jgi:ComF family protein
VEPARGGWPGSGAAFVYGGAIAGAIVRMKDEKRPDLGRPLGHLLWRAIEPYAAPLQDARHRARERPVVIPVPLHPSRLADRGFNQSSLVASHVAKGLGARFWPLALGRSRDTPQETELDRAARAANVAGAFFVRNSELVGGRRIVLVDDVRTTGATLAACARVLLSAGAASVAYAVIAHAAP